MENSQAQLLALFAKAVQQLQDNHIDYAPALEKGNVHTPMKAWRARKELSMLCPTLDPAEIGILVVAAKLLTGAIVVPAQLFITTPQAVHLVNLPPCCFFVQDNLEQVIKYW